MENNIPPLKQIPNAEAMAYFISLQEAKPSDAPEHSAEKWNKRAEIWKKERDNNRKGDERALNAVNYLKSKGLLQENFNVVDIGCGPGRFVAAFAKHVHNVVGLDISEKMVEHGTEHIKNEGLHNALLRTCDFQAMDLEKEGYKAAFDLVFSSMTPAIHGMNGLTKCIEMSRAWCCHITRLTGRNLLREQIMQEVFGRKISHHWTDMWFYSLFNVLFLMGYDPETSYDNRHQEKWVLPDEEYITFIMEHMLPREERTKDNGNKIQKWLQAHLNEDGLIKEVSDTSYGRILWDVRRKTERPDYSTMNKGI